MNKIATVLAGLVISSNVFAVGVTVTWEAPTTREDGSALLGSEIAGYVASITDRVTSETNSVNLDSSELEVVFEDVDPGEYAASIIVVDTEGNPSQPATKEFTVTSSPSTAGNTMILIQFKTVEEIIKSVEETYKVQ